MIWHSSSPPCRRSLPPRSPPSRQAQGCGGEQSQAPLKENLIGEKEESDHTPPPKAAEPPPRLPQISRGKVEGNNSRPEPIKGWSGL